MLRGSQRRFYDLVHSTDDNGWYAQVFGPDGIDLYTTPVCKTRKQAIADVMQHYEYAELLKEFS